MSQNTTTLYTGLDIAKLNLQLHLAGRFHDLPNTTAAARANLERAETLLNFCKITAPFSGVVTKRFVDPGAFVPAATA